jgi:riboflavin kinase / FMN adenylyltransferase
MQVIDDLARVRLERETVLTIGAFDGVHRGHQALVGTIIDRARAGGRLSAVLTFHPHPAMVLAPERAPRYLTTPGEKAALLERLGLDVLVLHPFNRAVAATSAETFMATVARQLRLRELWVGADFALGRNREGNVARLGELGAQFGYELHVIQPVISDEQVISSSRIRALLGEGRVAEAAGLLGRYPSVSGEVVTGARRGHALGFPTANLEVRPERAVPADGIYAVLAILGGERFPGVANVGVRPTFDNGDRLVETYIFDFDQDIYGCDLVVEFVARLRDELRFDNVGELIAQMGRDSDQARSILAAAGYAGPAPLDDGAGCSYRFREVEHTADRALWVWGADLPALFAGAARGMYSLMGDELGGEGLVPTEWRPVTLEAADGETLLVAWLNELLFLAETEELLFVDFQITSLSDGRLEARAGGVPAPVPGGHIKAATFHSLELLRDDRGWSTVITFDV